MESIFHDDKLTSAVIDRLVHHCHLISRIEVADLKIGDSIIRGKTVNPGFRIFIWPNTVFLGQKHVLTG
ncbi:MAG: ATP-binding protein [Kosmotogaceae bacterium]